MIKKGTQIYSGEPFVFVVNKRFSTVRCDHCLKSGKLLKCSACQYAHYCNRTCQKEAWKIHKLECVDLRNFPKNLTDDIRLVARIIRKLAKGGNNEKDYYGTDKFRQFKDLMSHKEEIIQDQNRMKEFNVLYNGLYGFIGKGAIPNYDEMIEVYGKMSINSFTISDNNLAHIGSAVYLGPSILDHSCKPNVTYVHDGTTMLITTTEDLPELDWSKLRVSYIDVMQSTERRRRMLKNRYYFHCNCKKCEMPELDAVCPNTNCINKCNPEDEICSQCYQKIPDNYKYVYLEAYNYTYQKMEIQALHNDFDVIQACLKKQEAVFHPSNPFYIKTLEAAVITLEQQNKWDEAEIYFQKIVNGFLEHYGEINFIMAILYIKFAKIYLKLDLMDKFSSILNKAQSILKILFGARLQSFFEEVEKSCLLDISKASKKMNNDFLN